MAQKKEIMRCPSTQTNVKKEKKTLFADSLAAAFGHASQHHFDLNRRRRAFYPAKFILQNSSFRSLAFLFLSLFAGSTRKTPCVRLSAHAQSKVLFFIGEPLQTKKECKW